MPLHTGPLFSVPFSTGHLVSLHTADEVREDTVVENAGPAGPWCPLPVLQPAPWSPKVFPLCTP